MNDELLAANIAAHWIQSGLLAAAAIVALRMLSIREPRFTLATLQLTFVAIMLLPMVQPWRPEEPALRATPDAIVSDDAEVAGSLLPATTVPRQAAGWWRDPARGLVTIVAAGGVIRMLWLFYGVFQLKRFSRRASELPAPAVAAELESEIGAWPRYVAQTGNRGPWTFGFFRSTVALPAGFDSLAPAFQRAVICHELRHVKRRDMTIAFGEELAAAVLWFHPWVWLLRARIRVAREQVVDRDVVALVGDRDGYVRCLVNQSGHDLSPHFSQAGAGMLRRHELRARVDAIFQEVPMSRTRFVAAAMTVTAVLAGTGWAAVLAKPLRAAPSPAVQVVPPQKLALPVLSEPRPFARAAQAAPAAARRQIKTSYADYPQDALEKGIRGSVLVDVTVNAAGDVTSAAVFSGPQELRASAFKAALGVKYEPGPSTTAMRLTVEFLLSPNSWGVRVGDGSVSSQARGTVPPQKSSEAKPDNALRIGGDILPPKKILNVSPAYPALAMQASVQGVVILEARIDESGNVGDTRVLRSIPLLDGAALEAVKQWKYEPTLMNGVAVPVIMTMTVNFTLSDNVRVQLVLPDGNKVILQVPVGAAEAATVAGPAVGRFTFQANRLADGAVTLSIYDFEGKTHFGDVTLRPGEPAVQTPTTPSFGVQLRDWQP